MFALDIEKDLGAFSLRAVIEAPESGVLALFGPSGAGKSSIVNAIAGLLRPDRGRIVLGERILFDRQAFIDVPPERRGVGYVFQDARLFPHVTVAANLLYGRRCAERRSDTDGLDLSLERVVSLLGLSAVLERRPRTLSGGERQRVALGRALLSRPRLLLLDEPLAALDSSRRAEILDYLEHLKSALDLPMIYVSHAVDEVVRLADRVAVVRDGRVAGLGLMANVLSDPALARLSGAGEPMAVIEAVSEGPAPGADDLTRFVFPGGTLALPGPLCSAGETVRLRLRAREVILAREMPAALSVRNALACVVKDVTPGGAGVVDVRLALGATTIVARITHAAAVALALAPDLPVFALIKSLAVDRVGGPGTTVDL